MQCTVAHMLTYSKASNFLTWSVDFATDEDNTNSSVYKFASLSAGALSLHSVRGGDVLCLATPWTEPDDDNSGLTASVSPTVACMSRPGRVERARFLCICATVEGGNVLRTCFTVERGGPTTVNNITLPPPVPIQTYCPFARKPVMRRSKPVCGSKREDDQ